MFRQSPSRNHRARGFKVKHVLQICVLIAVCIWLLYQVKHSHDKKKEFESNAKMSEKVESEHEIIKFGRKDLHPRVEESASETQKQNDEEETEEGEVKAEEEETKPEEEETKPEETEEEGRGGGDDEIDEHDQERAEEEAEHAEDFFVEEKDREEKDNEKEGQIDDTGSSEDQDLDGGDRTTQEAREEHYKGDDASSAVVRDAQEIENGSEEQVENAENESEQENKSQSIGKVSANQNDFGSKLVRDEKVEEIPSGIASATEEKATVDTLAKSEDVSISNSTITAESNDQKEMNDNSKADNAKTPALFLQNGTETITDPTEHQNASEVSGRPAEGGNKFPTDVLEQTEKPNATDRVEKSETSGEPTDASRISSSDVPELRAVESNVTAGTEDGSASSTTTAQGKKSDPSTETEENSNGSASSTTNENDNANVAQHDVSDSSDLSILQEVKETTNENDNANVAQHDVSDSSDLSILQEVKENRVDLGTLPETETEGTNHDDVATE